MTFRSTALRPAADAVLIRFTACLAHLHGDLNVRVNCLAPDWIATELEALASERSSGC
jgi:NAD(P)-dependent dehydrogenase (short-subunit alcohol dehydrogenase family)